MNKVPELASYSKEQISRASEFSPALKRYLALLDRESAHLNDSSKLRLKRHKVWCESVLATYYKNSTTEEICYGWSLASEKLISEAWQLAGGDDRDFIILALGKLGSRELNLSSDVDLVLVRRDDKIIDPKVLRHFTSILSELTEFAYCLRVDLNLRPGGGSGSLITSQTEFEYHYGYHGEMWERLSYVRARCIYGDTNLSTEILKFANHFSYRKHIDLTLIDDLSQLRNKIHFEISLKDQKYFNLKLSPGGIRDLEFFVHSLQLIHGGKNRLLQIQSTSEAIHQLKEAHFISETDAKFIFESYWFLRDVENNLQGKEDQQTYLIDRNLQNFTRFKVSDILALARKSHLFVSELLKISQKSSLPTILEEQQAWLRIKGFSEDSILTTWPEIISASAQSQKTESDETSRLQFLESFVEHLSSIDRNKDLALALLSDFIRATRAKASLYSLLNREKKLTEEMAWLFSCSPYLANIFALRPELIDSLFFNAQAELPKAQDEFLEMQIERRLLVEVLAAQKFLKDRDLGILSSELTFTADEICKTILNRLQEELQSEAVNVICLGKWGGRELGFRSDLDFIFLTDHEPTPLQQKLSRKVISWLNQPNRGGVIYNIDTRLRPSGHAGPLLVSKTQLENFLNTKADPWERQAYLRSRPLFETDFSISKIASAPGLSRADEVILRDIRLKLLPQVNDMLDLKLNPGGLVDIEFCAQISLLKRAQFSLDSSTQGMIQYLMEQDQAWKNFGPALIKNYTFLRTIEQMHQLTSSQSQARLKKNSQALQVLAANISLSIESLEQNLNEVFSQNSLLLEQLRGLM